MCVTFSFGPECLGTVCPTGELCTENNTATNPSFSCQPSGDAGSDGAD
jgi:hypothetical protein